MLRLLFAIFIIVPIVEMALLIKVGSLIGAGWTILAVLFTAALGAILLRLYSFQLVMEIREKLGRGELPAQSMLEGVLLAIGGALLLTPGFFTDAVGFSCLIPFTRKAISQWLIAKGIVKATSAQQDFSQKQKTAETVHTYRTRDAEGNMKESNVIEGEYTRED